MTVRLPLSAEDVARVYKKHARYYDKTCAGDTPTLARCGARSQR